MQTSTQLELNRVDTLIISVGTRQVGWRSHDGVVRCFGADGDRGHPPHIDRLYRELGVERGCYEDNQHYPWSVRDLGQRYYEHCREWLDGDFSAVVLLLDEKIISDCVAKGLKHIILWATNQPESVAWNYRRADTLWLAELMKGKIEATWKEVKVDVLHPMVNANHRETIREELEGFILPIALEPMKSMSADEAAQFVLVIENKGAVPAMAEGLEICAAALVRQCQVINATPIEPSPLFPVDADGNYGVCKAEKYDLISVSEYFWPLERLRVISAWERGDFLEAKIWLQSHQNRHKLLYQLAGYLAMSTNWEIVKFLKDPNFERGWLCSKAVASLASSEEINGWRKQLLELREDKLGQVWESSFLIELQLRRGNYTAAFNQFSQTLERLLYVRSLQEDWRGKGLIKIPEYWNFIKPYQPGFKELNDAWITREKIAQTDNFVALLTDIRLQRNDIVHQAEPVTLMDLRNIWWKNGWTVKVGGDYEEIYKLMMDILREVCQRNWQIPAKEFLRSLSDWGLKVLISH
ncbi:hypothetical protein [Argonema antarcticum]|uniref:hypothetical protein n=1 Tax=Argonema antarcticum TaxID=2942763 RepID=UPI00201294D8|nr:hypothetical protein [Argonema antarcticum]MCL1475600.1 hypothetical protein [Argonema antarcticum A004/B2]